MRKNRSLDTDTQRHCAAGRAGERMPRGAPINSDIEHLLSGSSSRPIERPQWVGSGSSSRALELALSSIKLTFTCQSSLGPQQTISVAVPQRAISVVMSNQKPWRR